METGTGLGHPYWIVYFEVRQSHGWCCRRIGASWVSFVNHVQVRDRAWNMPSDEPTTGWTDCRGRMALAVGSWADHTPRRKSVSALPTVEAVIPQLYTGTAHGSVIAVIMV